MGVDVWGVMKIRAERDDYDDARPDPDAVGVTPLPVKMTEKQRREIGQANKFKREPRALWLFVVGCEGKR